MGYIVPPAKITILAWLAIYANYVDYMQNILMEVLFSDWLGEFDKDFNKIIVLSGIVYLSNLLLKDKLVCYLF